MPSCSCELSDCPTTTTADDDDDDEISSSFNSFLFNFFLASDVSVVSSLFLRLRFFFSLQTVCVVGQAVLGNDGFVCGEITFDDVDADDDADDEEDEDDAEEAE